MGWVTATTRETNTVSWTGVLRGSMPLSRLARYLDRSARGARNGRQRISGVEALKFLAGRAGGDSFSVKGSTKN